MLFNSFEYLLFFPIVALLYFLLPQRFRWSLLLVASCIFYMYFVPIYIVILIGTIIIDYIAGILIEDAPAHRKKAYLVLSIISNVGVLAVFKYYNFFIDNINLLFHAGNSSFALPLLKMVLPIGLSFHTFQAMSYTIEVYRGNQKAERHLGIYALYVMFFPQLVAGPIERPQNVLHQFYEKHNFDWEEARQGMLLILWGLFKKVVIADRLALIVDNIYNAPAGHSSLSFLVATVFFTFQIYCDFSGYSDIALGSAQVLGFRLMTNFNRPYFAKSVAEFWTRWHISLSTWFRDYLYIPMGGNRLGKNRLYFNLAVVFILSGFWHGANYTFIIYGMFHAFYIIFGIATKKFRIKALSKIGIAYPSRINDILSVGIVFILCTFTRIFFRAKNVDDALYISNHLWQGWKPISASYLKAVFAEMGGGNLLFGTFNTVAGLLLIAILQYIDIITVNKPFHALLQNKPKALRWGFYYVLILSILLIGSYTNKEFIYFQF